MQLSPLASFTADLPRSRIARYVLALAVVAGATLLRLATDPLLHEQIPYFIYVAAVVVATWSCGVDGGAFATLLAAVAGNYLFVDPRYEIIPHPEDLVAMTLFAVVALGLVWLVGRWKRAEMALRTRAEGLRVLHDEAERANRMKDEFLATLSHELRTPLNAIVGWSQLLLDGRLDAARTRQAVETIARNAEAQTRLVEDVLDVSRIINGRLRLNARAVDLPAVVRAALDAVRPAASGREIDLRASFSSRAAVSGDADRLQQAIWNLLSNAVKFTPRRGRVEVSVEDRDSHVEIRVTDTGIGISAEFVPHLFERFSQQDSSTTRQHGGLGLGLAIVRHLVELHGGTVKAESPGQDQGATFTVSLPVRAIAGSGNGVDPLARVRELGALAPASSMRGLRVLVVDDEEDAREVISTLLRQLGAAVETAASAREALPIVRAWLPNVILADVGMPGEDGYAFIRQVRSLAPQDGGLTPAVALTAYGGPDDRLRALSAGYQLHVAKPAMPSELAAAVAGLALTNSR